MTASSFQRCLLPHLYMTLQMSEGKVSRRDMYNTFNMGVGLAMTVSPEHADEAKRALEPWGAEIIGECAANGGSVDIAL